MLYNGASGILIPFILEKIGIYLRMKDLILEFYYC